MKPPAVLLLSLHFHPSAEIGGRRMTALARYLAGKGVRVFVVSAFADGELEEGSEILPGIFAVPVKQPRRTVIESMLALKRGAFLRRKPPADAAPASPAPPAPRGSGGMRMAARELFFRIAYFVDGHKKWASRAARAAVATGRKHEVRLVLSSSPPQTALLAGTLAARSLGVPHIADLRDPWTDAPVSHTHRRLDYLLQRPLERWVVKRAAAVTSAGATVAALLARRYPSRASQVRVVRNGYDGELASAAASTGGRLSILFAGELYLGRDPFPLLQALEELVGRADVDASRVRLTLMGRCATYGERSLADWLIGKRCAANVRLLPQLPESSVREEVAGATVLLNLAQQQPLSVPAKTYEHLICGREMLLVCENDSETAALIRGICGVNQVDPRDPRAVGAALLDLYVRHVLEGRMALPSEEEVRPFSRDCANAQFWAIMQSLAHLEPDLPRSAVDVAAITGDAVT